MQGEGAVPRRPREDAATAPPHIVDSHVHLLPGRLAIKVRSFFEANMNRSLSYPIAHEAILDSLAAAGVREVWSLPYAHKPAVAAGLNEASADIVRAQASHPVRVLGGATLHPGDRDPVGLLVHAFDVLRLRILKLHCSVGSFDPDDPALDPTWAFVSARAIPVVVHVGHAISGHTNPTDVAKIANVAALAPNAIVIMAHCGHAAVDEVLDLLERFPNLYADLAPVVAEPVVLPRPEWPALPTSSSSAATLRTSRFRQRPLWPAYGPWASQPRRSARFSAARRAASSRA